MSIHINVFILEKLMFMRHFNLNRIFLIFLTRNMLKGVPKITVQEVVDFWKNFLVSISLKITQKTENDNVGRYRFG